MSRPIKQGSIDQSTVLRFIDSTDGTPETGITDATAGLALWYRREGGLKVPITPVALAALDTAHTDGGFEHISDGYARVDLPDLAVAAGANGVAVGGSATGMVAIGSYHTLVAYDPFDGVRQGLTALPNAVAGAASGLPLKAAAGDFLNVANVPQVAPDAAGGLPTTTKITDARLGSLTDWINGGRLDLLLDAIPTTAMRGTDNAALASVCTEARLQALTDWLNGGRLDLLLDAIPTTAMRGTDSAALASVCTEVRLQALTDWLNGGRLDLLLDAIPTTAMRGTDSAALASAYTAARAGYIDNLSAGAAALEATLTTIKGATFAGATDSLEAIRDRGDAAWVTATGFALASAYTAGRAVYLDELAAANLPADIDTIKAVTNKLDTTLVLDGAVYDFTAAALAAAPGGSAPTVTEIWAGLNAAQLAKFVTVDTTETTAVAGSVAKIAQGTASGLTAAEVAAAVWVEATRTLTQSAATTYTQVSGSVITLTRGDTLSAAITGLGSIATRSKLWFTVKEKKGDAADAAAFVQIEETGGLLYINEAAAVTAANGSITVNDEGVGNITVTLKPVESAKLAAGSSYVYDVQILTSAGVVTTLTSGVFKVTEDVTRATS